MKNIQRDSQTKQLLRAILIGLLTGGQSTAHRWTAYAGGLAAGLLPPLLFLAGSCIPIPALDRKDPEEHIEKQ